MTGPSDPIHALDGSHAADSPSPDFDALADTGSAVGPVRLVGDALVLTCEHAAEAVPDELAAHFADAPRGTHEVYDIGAAAMAAALGEAFGAEVHAGEVTRLVCDLNRSLTNPDVWSRWSRGLDEATRHALAARYHVPHWEGVHRSIRESLGAHHRVVQLGVHSFTPVWKGERRSTDLGVLVDAAIPEERRFAERWMAALRDELPELQVDLNRPYDGALDGISTAFRHALNPLEGERARRFLGVELEVNQRLWAGDPAAPEWRALCAGVCRSLETVLAR